MYTVFKIIELVLLPINIAIEYEFLKHFRVLLYEVSFVELSYN